MTSPALSLVLTGVLAFASGAALAGPSKASAPAATTAASLIGKPAPDFTLPDLDGKQVSLSKYKGKVVVLEWFNPGCPYVKKSHTVGSLVGLAKKHAAKGVVWLAINSNAAGKQGHDPAQNKQAAKEWSMSYPILRDVDGKVGKAYGATNTPHMFVIDTTGKVIYGGAIDNSPDGEGKSPTSGKLVNYVDAALSALAAKRAVPTPSTKAYGCSVKYGS